uniref:Uncharacterized protein n=1 Tax=Glossina austeni TaxID=7395 RepID=A0A1A9VJG2_GLOAU
MCNPRIIKVLCCVRRFLLEVNAFQMHSCVDESIFNSESFITKPYTPPLLTVNVPPAISSTDIRFLRALLAKAAKSISISAKFLHSTLRITAGGIFTCNCVIPSGGGRVVFGIVGSGVTGGGGAFAATGGLGGDGAAGALGAAATAGFAVATAGFVVATAGFASATAGFAAATAGVGGD